LKLVTVLLPEAYLAGLDELVRKDMYASRSSAIRSSVRDLLKKELWDVRGRWSLVHGLRLVLLTFFGVNLANRKS